ncbi:MAG: PepSY domain-containing protein [Candidatus Hydrogenedentes bacterium]|nr:PepSY domain-containing protein [Candidatus Hydrogenedentota bacterium]
MSPRSTRWIHAVHKWTGLIIGINVLLFSVTAAYLLVDEMAHQYLEHGKAEENVPLDPAKRLPLQPAIDQIETHFASVPGVVGRVIPAHFVGDLDRLLVVAGRGNYLIYERDPYTGALALEKGTLPEGIAPIGEAGPGATEETASLAVQISDFMLHLHAELFLEIWGTLLVGTLGVIFLVSTITGWIIYGPFMKAMAFGFIRQGRALHLRMADMHKLVGIAALAFNLLMAVTGIGLTFGIFGIQFQVMADLKESEAAMGGFEKADPLPSFDTVWAQAQSLYPDQYVSRIDFPVAEAIQGDRVYSSYAEPNPRDPGLFPGIGIITAEAAPRAQHYPLAWWMKAILVGGRLHTGALGGNLVLLAYLFLSLSSGFLSVSGYVMYIAKWRKARRAKAQSACAVTEEVDESVLPESAAAFSIERG